MMYKTHILISLLVGYIVSLLIDISNVYNFLLFCLLGGLLPDIDHSKSYLGNKSMGLSYVISKIFGHRGFFHSIFPPVILYLVFDWLNYPLVALGLFVGYFSHLFADALTEHGVNFLYPVTKFKLEGFVNVGGLGEYILFLILLIVDGYLLRGFIF